MTDQEILGAAMAYTDSHGGGGGTTNYNLLENKPQIAGTTLIGNKSLADLGIASASDLAAKQNALTAGDYIDITNDEISVDREISSVIAEYEIKTEPMVSGQAFISITKTVNGEVVLTQKYGSSTAGINQGINFDENIYVDYSKTASWSWTYKLRNASVDHAANYTQSWNYGSTVDYTEEFIVTDHSGDKLVIKSEMDTALADKADTDMVAADFNAGTSYTAGNYCVQDGKLYKFKNNHSGTWSSADVDEVKITGELSALKSGLTNVTSKVPIRGAFTVACSVGQNIFNRSTMTLVEGTIPTHSFAYCLFGICNHGSSLDSPNTVESDGEDSIIINAKSAQNIRIGWLDMTNIPFQTT